MTVRQHVPAWRRWLVNALLAAVWVAGFVSLAAQIAQQSPRDWSGGAAVRLQWETRYFQVPPDQVQRLLGFSKEALGLQHQLAVQQIEGLVDQQVKQLFAGVEERIPDYVDWQFSLSAEAGRWVYWLGDQLQLTNGDYLAIKTTEILFGGAHWDTHLTQVSMQARQQWGALQADMQRAWSSRLVAQLERFEVPAPITELQGRDYQPLLAVPLIDLQHVEQGVWRRAAVSSGAGIAAGLSAWRALSMRAATARVASRGVSRAGTAAAGSAALCSPSGPGAVGCAVVAGVATWLATEWALLQAEKALTQATLTQALQESVTALRSDMRAELTQHYQAALADYRATLQAGVTESFVPAQRWH